MPQSPEREFAHRPLRIVIPACNEEGRIEPTLHDYGKEFARDAVVVVVANGCSDATAATARRLVASYPNLEVLDVPARIGKGGAVRLGLAGGDEPHAGFVDADGSTSAREFRRLYAVLARGDCDVVIGSRWCPGATVSTAQSLRRRIASRTFNAIVNLLFGLGFYDTQCGAKIFERRALADVLPALELADYAFDIELLWRLKRAGRRIREEATVWTDRVGSGVDLGRVPWTMLKSIVRLRAQDSPLWRIPLVDRLGRGNLIPVRAGRTVLALHRPDDPLVRRFYDALERRGVAVVYADEEARAAGYRSASAHDHPWRSLAWYALASRRQYDGILELAGEAPTWLARLSSKPRFRVVTTPGFSQAIGGTTDVVLADERVEELAALIDTVTLARLPYRAVFVDGHAVVAPDLPRAAHK